MFDLVAVGDESITLSWTERLRGDFDQNGEANISDLTPLSFYFLQAVQYDDPAARQGFMFWPSGDHADTGGAAEDMPPSEGSGALNWRKARVDADGNGEINISELTPLANAMGQRLDGYRIYRREDAAAEWTLLPDPDSDASDLTVARPVPGLERPVRYTFVDPDGSADTQYKVVAYDSISGGEGPDSVIVSAAGGSQGMSPTPILTASPDSGEVPLDVSLDASASTDPLGDSIVFDWDLDGDGSFEFSSGLNGTITNRFDQAGDLNVAVRTTNLSGFSSVKTMELQFTDAYDEQEPNDAVGTSSPMGKVTRDSQILDFNGSIGFPGYDGFTEDWLRFTVDAGLEVGIAILPDTSVGDLSSRLIDSDGRTFIANSTPTEAGEAISFKTVIPGDYYLRIKQSNTAITGAINYSVSIAGTPLVLDDTEPNDSLAAPQVVMEEGLPAGELALGTFDFYGQVDAQDTEDWWNWLLPPDPDKAYRVVATLTFSHAASDLDLDWWYFNTDQDLNDYVVWRRSFGTLDKEVIDTNPPTSSTNDGFDDVPSYLRVTNYGGNPAIYHLRLEIIQ